MAYLLKLKLGYFVLRYPVKKWETIAIEDILTENAGQSTDQKKRRLAAQPPFLFSSNNFDSWRENFFKDNKVLEGANKIIEGCFPFYNFHWFETGNPPDWFMDYFANRRLVSTKHWSLISDRNGGDIKNIWELSRFGWVYFLLRAYARDGNTRWAEAFWSLTEDWLLHNPPQTGPQWKCGQEISFRVMAWTFGLYAFVQDAATTPKRVECLLKAIFESATRIEANLSYAVSQNNNHSVSEASVLISTGLLFPELRPAKRWLKKGMVCLDNEVQRLFFEDGGFCQNSYNYQRVAMQDLIWAKTLMEKNGLVATDCWRHILDKGARFLAAQAVGDDYHIPLGGAIDGALVFPLSGCDFFDFRPFLQNAWYAAHGKRLFAKSGVWDEELLWFHGLEALDADVSRSSLQMEPAGSSGIHLFRGGEFSAIFRAPRYEFRPLQADLLHVDVAFRGKWLTTDAGTFSYEGRGHLKNALKSTHVHNTVAVDGENQIGVFGKFLMFPWVSGEKVDSGTDATGQVSWLSLAHSGYQRLSDPVIHFRTLIHTREFVWVVDSVKASVSHLYRVHWLLEDISCPVQCGTSDAIVTWPDSDVRLLMQSHFTSAPTISKTIESTEDERGWVSRYYQHAEPALSLSMESEGACGFFTSLFTTSKKDPQIIKNPDGIVIQSHDYRVAIEVAGRGPILDILSVKRQSETMEK